MTVSGQTWAQLPHKKIKNIKTENISPKLEDRCHLPQCLLLKDENIQELITQKSLTFKEQEIKKLNIDSLLELSLQPYKWSFSLDLSNELDRTDSITTLSPANSTKLKSTATLSKKWESGTLLSFDLTHLNYQTASGLQEYNSQALGLGIEQNIIPFYNFNLDRLNTENARLENEKSLRQWKIDKISTLKNVLSLYWQIKSLRLSIEENKEVYKKYESLVATVQRKKSNNFATAGEYEQAMAELQTREAQMRDDLNTLEQKMIEFRNELGIDPQIQIVFSEELSEVKLPENHATNFEETNIYQIQKIKTQIADNQTQISEGKDLGKLSLYAKLTPTGVDPQFSESINELSHLNKNKFLFGIKYDKILDDGSYEKDTTFKKALKTLEQTRLDEMKVQLDTQIKLQYQSLVDSFKTIQTQKEIVTLREQALESIYRSYQQGRIEISILIDTYSKMVASKVNLTKAYGNFYDKWLSYQSISTQD